MSSSEFSENQQMELSEKSEEASIFLMPDTPTQEASIFNTVDENVDGILSQRDDSENENPTAAEPSDAGGRGRKTRSLTRSMAGMNQTFDIPKGKRSGRKMKGHSKARARPKSSKRTNSSKRRPSRKRTPSRKRSPSRKSSGSRKRSKSRGRGRY